MTDPDVRAEEEANRRRVESGDERGGGIDSSVAGSLGSAAASVAGLLTNDTPDRDEAAANREANDAAQRRGSNQDPS